LEPFSFSNSALAVSDPALRVPIAVSVPSTILLTSTIDPANDFDLYSLSVVAGQTYMISVRGTGTTPLTDSIIALFDDAFDEVGFDDDGGSGTNSLLTFTAAYTGTYFIDVEAYPGSGGTGEYTLDVIVRPATDVVDSTFANAVLINPGVTFGFIDSDALDVYGFAGETDTFKIEMEAGKFYQIEVAGGADYSSSWFDLPPGEIDPWIFLYGPDQTLVAQNDDISFPDDISSRIGFFAQVSGTYYLDVQSWYPWTGGYTITLTELNLADFDPLDAINWFSADNIDTVNVAGTPTAYVYFGGAGETFGEAITTFGWNPTEKAAVMTALLEFTKITGIQYVETTNINQAEFRLNTVDDGNFGAYFYPQDPDFGPQQGIGIFNVNSGGWDKPGVSDQDIPGNQVSLVRGGYSFAVILHEFGHAHGLAHPHDNGGGSDILLGVTGPFDSYGVFDLNQGVYTVMSYNDAWQLHPDGPSPFTIAGIDNGWSGTLSAFDIAVLQQRYGVHAFATGNNVYQLKDVTAQGTYYETIWDTGGTDEIRYSGARNAQIDLTAATLDYSPTGGGVISFVDDIKGGYTIANGVVIENATGGSGHDILIGNGVANVLTGNNGDDFLMGGAGGDTLSGGGGFDTASYRNANSGVVASLTSATGAGSGSAGDAAGDSYSGIEKLEGSNFADTLSSGNGGHSLFGMGGNDSLSGGNDNDTLDGGDGNDSLDGGNHNDILRGGAGNDILSGGNHNDTLEGGTGNDTLDGGNQTDWLNGGAGNDVMTGGNQADFFVFGEIGGADRITDFKRGDDKIDLSLIDAIAGGGDNAFSFIGAAAFSGVAGQLRSYTQGSDKFLAGDVNGDGVADFTIQTNILIIAADLYL